MLKKSSIIFLFFFAISCSSISKNFNDYHPQPLPKSAFMPSPDLVAGKAYKVVVFNLDEDNNEIAKQAGLGKAMTVNVENILTSNNLAQLVDRNIASKLEKEIALAEMNQSGGYKGPEVADYAISGSISNASFTKKYSSGTFSFSRDGRIVRVPPKFTYSSEVDGNVKIYELPSMTVAASFELKGKKTRTENVQADNNISVMGVVDFGGTQNKGVDRDDNLLRKAGEEAVELITYDVKNFLARRGYILEKRAIDDKQAIFKINLGKDDGIAAGDVLEVVGKYDVENQLTEQGEIEKRIIATGKVSDKIDPKSAWIVLDNKKDIDSVRLGDVVQLKYKRGFWNKVGKSFSKMMDWFQ